MVLIKELHLKNNVNGLWREQSENYTSYGKGEHI